MKLTENTKVRIKVPKHLYEAIQAELAKKEMEEMAVPHDGHEKMEEDVEPVVTGVELTADKMGKLVGIDPTILGALIVGGIVAGTLKGPELVDVVKTSLQVALDKGQEKYNALKSYFKRKNVDTPKIDTPEVGAKAEPVAEDVQELEEVLDLQSLMEAVKDLSKKKAEEKKKKEAEDKKKKEAEAKKKADAKKKK